MWGLGSEGSGLLHRTPCAGCSSWRPLPRPRGPEAIPVGDTVKAGLGGHLLPTRADPQAVAVCDSDLEVLSATLGLCSHGAGRVAVGVSL